MAGRRSESAGPPPPVQPGGRLLIASGASPWKPTSHTIESRQGRLITSRASMGHPLLVRQPFNRPCGTRHRGTDHIPRARARGYCQSPCGLFPPTPMNKRSESAGLPKPPAIFFVPLTFSFSKSCKDFLVRRPLCLSNKALGTWQSALGGYSCENRLARLPAGGQVPIVRFFELLSPKAKRPRVPSPECRVPVVRVRPLRCPLSH